MRPVRRRSTPLGDPAANLLTASRHGVPPVSTISDAHGTIHRPTPISAASRASTLSEPAGQESSAAQEVDAGGLQDVVANLAALHRSRLNFVSAKVKIELQIKAIQRQTHARAGCDKPTHAKCPGVYKINTPDIQLLRELALAPLEAQANARLKAMLAELPALPQPVLDYTDGIRGFGRASLAQIVAEAGDLTRYGNPAKLWGRMGVGLAPDKSPRYEGRSPRRRSVMHVIGDNFVKSGGPFRELYDQRKEFERGKPPCGKTLKNAKGEPAGECRDADGAECCKAGHIHNRTLRYIEKRLLRDLWRAWTKNAGEECPAPRDTHRTTASSPAVA